MPISVGDIELHLGPKEQGGDDSLSKPIVAFIERSKKRQNLMIAVQEIDNREIANAIIAARLRGVTIDLVLEQSYLFLLALYADRGFVEVTDDYDIFVVRSIGRLRVVEAAKDRKLIVDYHKLVV